MSTPPATSASRVPRRVPLRIPILAVLLITLIGVGVADHEDTAPSQATIPLQAAFTVPPSSFGSSSWYCTGGTGNQGSAALTTLDLVNTSGRAVRGSVTVLNDAGASHSEALDLTPHSQGVVPASLVQPGNWLAADVELQGGGVLVTQSDEGPSGWSEAPCSSTTSNRWYFASGSTSSGSSMSVSIFNPTAGVAVADLEFITSSGVTEPQPFEGVVIEPHSLVVEPISQYVQNQSLVSTIVQAQTGRVVADELQTVSESGVIGSSVRLGSPFVAGRWSVPRSLDVATGNSPGGTTIEVLNPFTAPERVRVEVQIASGRLMPFNKTLLGQSAWTLDMGRLIRVPANVDYSTEVTASGLGVVVDRITRAASGSQAPQFGVMPAIPIGGPSGATISVVAGPGVAGEPAVPGAAPSRLAIANPTASSVSATVYAIGGGLGSPMVQIAKVRIKAGSFAVLVRAALEPAGLRPILVEASGPVTVAEDVQPPLGVQGVVSIPGAPISG